MPQIWAPESVRVIEKDRDKNKNSSLFIFSVFNNCSVISSVIKINKKQVNVEFTLACK